MTTTVVTAVSKSGESPGQLFLDLAHRLAGAPPQLVVVFASPACELEAVMQAAAKHFASVPTVACTTAGEFTEQAEGTGRFTAWVLAGDDVVARAGLGEGLRANPEAALTAAIGELPDDPERRHHTAIVLLDPLSGNGEETALLASTLLGPTVRLAGGAAGDDLGFKQTRVACGTHVASDAVVVALLASRKPLAIGVLHGHTPISKPLTITKASGATVQEIDGRPAFEVWKDQVRATARTQGIDIEAVPSADIGAQLLRYEVGLVSGANEYKIRAPLSVAEGGALNFACGIPEGAVVRVTESIEDAQVASARGAAQRARKALGSGAIAGALVFDCICRRLILGSRYESAVQEIHQALGGVPLAGFATYGEIAMDLGQSSGFHNTTTVVLAFPK